MWEPKITSSHPDYLNYQGLNSVGNDQREPKITSSCLGYLSRAELCKR